MATTKDSAPSPPSTPKVERLRIARLHALKEAVHRFNNELMDDDEERMLLLDRIRRLRRTVETDAETVDAIHSGLDQL
jgi:hypothetical protein